MSEQGGALAGLWAAIERYLTELDWEFGGEPGKLDALWARVAAEVSAVEARLALVDGCVAEVARAQEGNRRLARFVRADDAYREATERWVGGHGGTLCRVTETRHEKEAARAALTAEDVG